jgi:hypothetical protein
MSKFNIELKKYICDDVTKLIVDKYLTISQDEVKTNYQKVLKEIKECNCVHEMIKDYCDKSYLDVCMLASMIGSVYDIPDYEYKFKVSRFIKCSKATINNLPQNNNNTFFGEKVYTGITMDYYLYRK